MQVITNKILFKSRRMGYQFDELQQSLDEEEKNDEIREIKKQCLNFLTLIKDTIQISNKRK